MIERPLDYSQLNLFYRCPMLWRYRYIMGLDIPTHPSAQWSKYLIHKPIEYLWTDQPIDWDALFRSFVGATRGVMDDLYTLDHAQRAVDEWERKFWKRDREEYELVSAEGTREVPSLPGFVTKPDLVLRRREDQKIFVKDFKSSKYQKDVILFDRQFLGQVLGYEADGFSRDLFLLKLTKKDGFSVEVTRDEEEVPRDLLDEWIRETRLGMQLIEKCIAEGVFPKNAPDACYPFPRIKCEMVDYCAMGEMREEVLERFPRKDPYEYLK